MSSENNDILKKIMIFYGHVKWSVWSSPVEGLFSTVVLYPYKRRDVPTLRRNFTPGACIQGLLGSCQVGLESRLIGASGALAVTKFPIRRPISNIPFLEDVRRTK